MAEIRTGTPIPGKRKGRPGLWDIKINCVAGIPDKYIHEKNACRKESIRHRARRLGFSVKTFASAEGGWDIKIS